MRIHSRGNHRAVIVVVAAAVTCLATAVPSPAAAALPGPAMVGRDTDSVSNGQIGRLIAAMTLDEKLGMVNGWPDGVSPPPQTDRLIGVGFIPGVPRLGIPALTFTDGPAGVRMNLPTTAMPAPVALAATFSAEIARNYGSVLGRDARARDQDVIFAPMINTVRVPQAGRNFETLGEDPFLVSHLVVPEINGIQATGTIATAKHYAENNQENNRQGVNVNVDERTLHEIELRGFEAAVRQGHSGSVMCSYNSVNGKFACENPTLLTDILRNRWGFTGFVVSDYGANHSAGPALQAGLDIEFFGTHFHDLKAAIQSGAVPVAALDRAVRHILTTMQRFGLLAHASPDGAPVVNRPIPPFPLDADARQARAIAEQGAVLLRNERNALPLGKDDLSSLAVIGPTARQLLVGGGGSSRVLGVPGREVSPLTALQQAGANATFRVGRDLQGVAVPSAVLAPPNAPPGEHGLLRTDTTTGAQQIDPMLDFVGATALPAGTQASWTGTLTAPVTGDYLLAVQTAGTGAALTVDGTAIDTGGILALLGTSLRRTTDGLTNASVHLHLTAGSHTISVAASPIPAFPPFIEPSSGPVQIRLAWVTPQQRQADFDAAVAAARHARTAVVFAYMEGTEGVDQPTLALPNEQDQLIAAVAKASPRTVVVLNSGYPVLMPWLHDVRSVLDMWYPGQEGGWATADLLTGAAVPGGKLPMTFPAREADAPTATSPLRYPGVNNQEFYSEGIYVGYRWYDAMGIQPLFPFGFGLSYTTFAYSNLKIIPGTRRNAPRVRFTVTNTGSRTGTEVAQVYAGQLPTAVPTPPKQLAGVAQLTLRPGQSRQVTVELDLLSLSFWDTTTHRWLAPAGQVPVLVGSSSRDIRLRGTLLTTSDS
ncbi:MAG: beta-glucosidase [Actinobacteria bacterium]|nr:MAG: beta-glucosidase [Actinomycetota bacterium]